MWWKEGERVSATSCSERSSKTRMWADAQRDGRLAEYIWRPLRKFRNSIPCTTPQSLAEAGCWSANILYKNARLRRKVNFARAKIP